MDVLNLTKITIAWELFESGLPKIHIAEKLSVNRGTVHLWIRGAQEFGLLGFMDKYSHAKKGERVKRQIDAILKRRIWGIRDREMDCCGQKIKYFMDKEYGSSPAVSKIYEILAEKYKLKSKWKKNQKRGPVPKASKPREVVQMDTVDFGDVFAFTGIDIFSKEAVIKLYGSLTAKDGLDFLRFSFNSRYHHTELLQTDGGHEFKAKLSLKEMCLLIQTDLGLLLLTGRMNSHILRVSTGLLEKNVLGGVNTSLLKYLN